VVPGRPDLPRRRRPARHARLPAFSPLALRLAAAAGAAAVLAGGGYGIWQALQPAAIVSAQGSNAAPYRGAGAGAAVQLPYRSNGGTAVVTVRATRRQFEPGTIKAVLRHDLARPAAAGEPAPTYAPRSSPKAGRAPLAPAGTALQPGLRIGAMSVRALQGCVSRIAAGRLVLLAETGFYRGQPAVMIARAEPRGAVGVWIVGTACSASESDVLAQLTLRG
jgi:hypothetical protein